MYVAYWHSIPKPEVKTSKQNLVLHRAYMQAVLLQTMAVHRKIIRREHILIQESKICTGCKKLDPKFILYAI